MKTQQTPNHLPRLGMLFVFLSLACCCCIVTVIFVPAWLPSRESVSNENPAPTAASVENSDLILQQNAVVLDDSAMQKLSSVSEDGETYVFDSAISQSNNISVGDVIVAGVSPETPNGVLRKVESISTDNTNIVLTTRPASLEDAIYHGDIDFSEDLTPADDLGAIELAPGVTLVNDSFQMMGNQPKGNYKDALTIFNPERSSNPFVFKLDNVPVYDDDGDLQTTTDQIVANGYLNLIPAITVHSRIVDGHEEKAQVRVELKQTLDLDFSGELKNVYLDKEITIARINPRRTFYVGIVPVTVRTPITVNIGVTGNVSGAVSMHVVGKDSVFIGGEQQEDGGWLPIADNDPELKIVDEPKISVGQEIKGYVGLNVAIVLYDAIGVDGQAQIYLLLNAKTGQEPWWVLSLGAEFVIGVQINFLSEPFYQQFPSIKLGEKILSQAETGPVVENVPTPKPTTVPEKVYEPLPGEYQCPDLNNVQLRVGMNGKVIFQEVNLRSEPIVPQVWKSNIVITLTQGDRIKIIDGPICAHDGTWWKAKFGSYIGWVREMIPATRYLKPLD